jgi:branched-chain amino acid transport system substrate-binding protein
MNIFPVTAAREMYEPLEKLKFGGFTPYYDQMRAAVKYFVEKDGIKQVGVMYQDDDFGKNVLDGCVDQAKEMGLPAVVETNFKRGAKDFSSQIAQLKSGGVELVCLGTIIGETIGGMATAKKIGFDTKFVVSSAGYVPENILLAKGLTEGLYGTGQTPIPYYEDATAEVKEWMDSYKGKFGKDAVLQSVAGYDLMQVFAMGLEGAGPDLTAEKVAEALESIKGHKSIFGGAEYNFSDTDHLGPDARNSASLYQVKGPKWEKIGPISY